MTGIGNISNVTHFIAKVHKVPVDHIKCYIRPGMTKMTFAAYGRTAHIHAHMAGSDGFKYFFLPCI